jgi:hypothetical protein
MMNFRKALKDSFYPGNAYYEKALRRYRKEFGRAPKIEKEFRIENQRPSMKEMIGLLAVTETIGVAVMFDLARVQCLPVDSISEKLKLAALGMVLAPIVYDNALGLAHGLAHDIPVLRKKMSQLREGPGGSKRALDGCGPK